MIFWVRARERRQLSDPLSETVQDELIFLYHINLLSHIYCDLF